jgi:hypothetical protein
VKRGSDRLLALKLLRESNHSDRARERAWRELNVLSDLRSPFIPRVHEFGVHEGRLYIVTDFVDGMPLETYVQSRGLDRRAQVELLARIAQAVQTELHERGVIHRDLKPSNVLVDRFGQPVIIDLGIAQVMGEHSGRTITTDSSVIGTPAFMAPEQARGERRAISTRTDVYSLGATAMYLLSGRGPHPRDIALHELIRRIAQEPAEDPLAVDASLPKPLAAVLRRSVAFDADDRYESAGDFAADLLRWTRGELVTAVEPSLWQQARWFARRRKGLVAAVIVAALASVGSALAAWMSAEGYFSRRMDELVALAEIIEKERVDVETERKFLRERFERLRIILTSTAASTREDVNMRNIENAAKLVHGLSLIGAGGAYEHADDLADFQASREDLAVEVLHLLYAESDEALLRRQLAPLNKEELSEQ